MYRLQYKDNNNCPIISDSIFITNTDSTLANPVYVNQVIFINTNAILTNSNNNLGTYILYKDANGNTELQRNTTGIFNTGNLSITTTFYIQLKNGNCFSNLVPVTITVTDKADIYIPTVFTPMMVKMIIYK
jgi:hypothetical protein